MIKFVNSIIGYKKELIKVESIDLEMGGIYALIGKNGSGKTTLLNTILGQVPLLSGDILIDQKSIQEFDLNVLSKTFAFVESRFDGIENLKVYDYIALGRSPYTDFLGRLKADDHCIIGKAIEKLGLSFLMDKYTKQISDGERQLCAIARAIVQETPFIVLDEPTSFLDYGNRNKLLTILKNIANEEKKCIIFSSHDVDLIVEQKIDVLFIHKSTGKLILKNGMNKSDILNMVF